MTTLEAIDYILDNPTLFSEGDRIFALLKGKTYGYDYSQRTDGYRKINRVDVQTKRI